MATILSNKKSTYGSPYAFYTVTVTTSNRTANSITCKVKVTANLQYEESWQGKGITITPYIKLKGTNYKMPALKSSSETWSGTASRSVSKTITIGGLSTSQTSISASFRVDTTDDSSSLASTTCDNITFSAVTTYTVAYNANGGEDAPSKQTKIKDKTLTLSSDEPVKDGYSFLGWATSSSATTPKYYAGGKYTANASATLYAVWELDNGKSSITLSKSAVDLGGEIRVGIKKLISTNKHTIVWKCGSNSYTSHTKTTSSSVAVNLSESIFSSWFGSTEQDIEVSVTVTTYNSGGTSLGSVTKSLELRLTETMAKANKPAASVTESSNVATITLTEPSFKYGATFGEWQIDSESGNFDISGNIITASLDEGVNRTAVATIRALDSRGFLSDPIDVVWHSRKRGACIYKDDMWKPTTLQVYKNDSWVDGIRAYIYLEGEYIVS